MSLSPRSLFHWLLERRAKRLTRLLAWHLPRDGRLLDVGSGLGHNARELVLALGGTCWQADVVDFHVVGDPPILFDGRRLPLADGAVDACLLIHVLGFSDDPTAILREAGRVARRRVVVVQTTYHGRLGWIFLRGRGWIQGRAAFALCRAIGLVPAVKNPMGKRRCFTPPELRAIVNEAGLIVEHSQPEPGAKRWVRREFLVLGHAIGSDQRGAAAPGFAVGPSLSVVIPARNESSLLGATLESVLRAIDDFNATGGGRDEVELVVVDDGSSDGTPALLARYEAGRGIRVARREVRGAARARNLGASLARGRILVFLDADTHLPIDGLRRIATLCDINEFEAGITRLGALDGGWRARGWWAFWNAVRRLPIPRAKAMPACMFCTREAFDEFGPFDERVAIGEEWPILAGLYRSRPRRFIYDRATVALSSGRRMELQPWGYTRTFLKYAWAILSFRGRVHYHDRIRHAANQIDSTSPSPRSPSDSGNGNGRRLAAAHGLSVWLGRLLARVRLNAVESRRMPDDQLRIAKRRRWLASWLIPPGNFYLRRLRAAVQVLPDARWHAREIEVHHRLHGFECKVDERGWILLPHWPGRPAAEYCADASVPREARVSALEVVVRALRELHQDSVWEGTREALSHGDATLRNVVYDPKSFRARWIDFDTAHDPAEAVDRHADDLRAALYSALEALRDASVETIVGTVRAAYDEPTIWGRLRDRLLDGPLHAGAFHMAQAAPRGDRRRELERWIRTGD